MLFFKDLTHFPVQDGLSIYELRVESHLELKTGNWYFGINKETSGVQTSNPFTAGRQGGPRIKLRLKLSKKLLEEILN